MNRIRLISFLIIAIAFVFQINSQTPWLHVYRNNLDFFSVKLNDIKSIHHKISNTSVPIMKIDLTSAEVDIPIRDVEYYEIGTNVPSIFIETVGCTELEDLVDKETYIDALITIDGMGLFEDVFEAPLSIKGRGNSTWRYPKKPYRLKFPKKIDLLGISKCKNYALIANYIDCSLMRNAVAFEVAKLLEMPFTNHIIPVRVYFNGNLKGAYILTEKIGISSSSVNIDEGKGVLFELDGNYDEKYRFRSHIYDLPVMIKDPELDEIAEEQGISADLLFEKWENDFNEFENKVYNGTLIDKVDYDMESLINYLIVYNLCGNREITWPKSTFLYKQDIDSPFMFGPIWDFDWAFTYNNGEEDKEADIQLLAPWTPLLGQPFFKQLCSDSSFMKAYGERWKNFQEELLPSLYHFIEDYASTIRPSALENGVIWPSQSGTSTSSFDFDLHIKNLSDWIKQRVSYISSHPNFGLYE